MPKRTKAYLALLTTALIWGPAFVVIKPSFDHVSPFQFLFFRYLIAAPLTLPVIFYFYQKLKPNLKTLLKIISIELSGIIGLSILYLGLDKTSALEASLIGATSPIIATLGGIIFLKEKEERNEWIGLAISFLGTIILVVEPLFMNQSQLNSFSLNGNLLILLYNFTSAIYYLSIKKHYSDLPRLFTTSISYSISAIFFFLFLLLTNTPTSVKLLTIPSVAIASFYMAILGSIVALTTRIYGQELIEASEASLFNYLHGVLAIPAAYFLLKEAPTSWQLIAMTIISFGVFLAEYRPRKITR